MKVFTPATRTICLLITAFLLLFSAGCTVDPAGKSLSSISAEVSAENETSGSSSGSALSEENHSSAAEEIAEADTALETAVQEKLQEMTLEEKIAQMFVITPEALTGVGTAVAAGETTKLCLSEYPVGGLIYMADNLVDTEQTQEMLANTMAYSLELTGLPIFLCIDEEGGSVTRVAGNSTFGVEDVGDMAAIGQTGNSELAYAAGVTIGTYLNELGFNVDFAPVADVLTNAENTVVALRSFGADAELVSSMVHRLRAGLEENGILACIKHFPGHGATSTDTHEGTAVVSKTWEELLEAELIPFADQIEAGVSMIMVGHFSLPLVTGDYTPCSLSYTVITEKLRGELGYNGIVITDALNMSAITENCTSGEAAVAAVQAGADLLLMPEDFTAAYEALLAAVESGEISEERIDESAARILWVKLLF